MQEWEVCLRLVLSCIMGGIIGYERQMRHKSAGLRTNMLVALGACLIMLLSQAITSRARRTPIPHGLRRRSSAASAFSAPVRS